MKKSLFWLLFFICHLTVTLIISWHLLAKIDYGYPIAYELLGMEEHINEYAPQNNYKKYFEFTKAKDHKRYFSDIA